MAVYQHKNGRWYLRFQIKDREYNRAVPEATCRRDAEKAEIRFKNDLLQGKYTLAENKKDKTFEEMCKIYEDYAKNSKSSWKGNVSPLNNLSAFFRNRRLREITPQLIEKYRDKRKAYRKNDGTPLKNATINREIEILRKMFNMAIDSGWLEQNPCSSRKAPLWREDNKKERFLLPNEEERLLLACTGQFAYLKPIIICALQTGMRKGEILGLTWDCVNLERGYITLIKTKSNKVRKIPINGMLKREMMSLKKVSNYVFANPITKEPYYDLKTSFPALCKKAEVYGLVFHDLRHTAATRMVDSGAPLPVVQEILGHADVKTTMRYAHPVPEQKMKAIECLENYCLTNINRPTPVLSIIEKQQGRQNTGKAKKLGKSQNA